MFSSFFPANKIFFSNPQENYFDIKTIRRSFESLYIHAYQKIKKA
jgi:hypothetical protein